MKGFPIHQPETFIETGEFTRLTSGSADCDRAAYSNYVSLPVGPVRYINVIPAQFAKTDLTLKMNDNGAVTELVLNSEPTSGEIIKNVAEAIKTIAPIAGLARPQGDAAPLIAEPGMPKPSCNAVPDPKTIQRTPFKYDGAAQ